MAEHVLVVGGGLDLPSMLRGHGDGARTSVFCQLAVVAKLREQTKHARIVGLRADAPTSDWVRMADAVHAMDPFTRIASFAERDQDRAAAIGEALGLTMHSTQTIAWVHHKPSMRARLSDAGVDDTPYRVVHSAAELREFVRINGYPCIVKPAIGAGSIAISRVDTDADVEAALVAASAEGEWTRGGAFVERLLQGPQFSVEAFSEGGEHEIVCVTRKFSDPHHYVEVGHVLPAELPGDDRDAIARCVRATLDALRIEFGPTHTELVRTDRGPRIIETHTRLAGDELPNLVRDATGIDLSSYTVRQVLGETGLLKEIRSALADTSRGDHEAIWYATARAAGTLDSVSAIEAVRAREGVREVVIQQTAGSRLRPLSCSDSRLAFVRARGTSADEAVRRAREAAQALQFRILLDTTLTDSPV